MNNLIFKDDVINILKSNWKNFSSADEAIKVSIRSIKNIPPVDTERRAKVDDQYKGGEFKRIYECGSCGACGTPVINPDKYCSECGARLEWE